MALIATSLVFTCLNSATIGGMKNLAGYNADI